MWEIQLSELDTLIHLSVALNLACVAIYKTAPVYDIIESYFLSSQSLLQKEIDEFNSRMYIIRSNTGLLSKKSRKKKNSNLENVYVESVKSIDSVEEKILTLENLINTSTEKINNFIKDRCTPTYMAAICTFLGITSIEYLFLIFYKSDSALFCIFTCLVFLGVIVFIISKVLFKILIPDAIIFIESKRIAFFKTPSVNKLHILLIYNNLLNLLNRLRNRRYKMLSIKHSFFEAIKLLIFSFIILLIYNHFELNIFSQHSFITGFIFKLSAFIPYSSFFIYLVVIFLQNRNGEKYINSEFKQIKESLSGIDRNTTKKTVII